MTEKEIKIKIAEYDSINELSKEEQELIEAAKASTDNAYAPYSKFHVGAAVLLDSGEIITGTNQENAAYPSGLCAERVALFYANSKFPKEKVKAMAIAAKTKDGFTNLPISPCGSCRQVILETQSRFSSKIKVILYGEDKIIEISDAGSLLPISFTDKFLGS